MFRALAALFGYYLAVAMIAVPLTLAIPPAWEAGPFGIAVQTFPLVVGALLVNALLVRQRLADWEMLGWAGPSRGPRAFGRGVGIGLVMALGALLFAVLFGSAGLELTGDPLTAFFAVALPVLVGLAVAALAEEVLFRGFPLARLAKVAGKAGASVALAVVFAVAHLGNPEATPLGLVNIGLASLVLSAAFFTPGGIYAAWGVHLGWNAGLGVGADAPVSGIALGLPVLEFRTGGPSWVTGGAFGPEGGLAATVAMGLALIWLARQVAGAGEGDST